FIRSEFSSCIDGHSGGDYRPSFGGHQPKRRPPRMSNENQGIRYSTIDCITAVSKSRIISWLDVCTIRRPTSFSLGSTQKCVPKAPCQPNDPFERVMFLATASVITRTLSPQASPRALPGNVSGA